MRHSQEVGFHADSWLWPSLSASQLGHLQNQVVFEARADRLAAALDGLQIGQDIGATEQQPNDRRFYGAAAAKFVQQRLYHMRHVDAPG